MKLFSGYEHAYGQYKVFNKSAEGKLSGRALTISEPPTIKNYQDHLNGEDYILGIIMLKSDNTCSFGAIDIDIKGAITLNEKLEDLEKRIKDTPLVLCRSKSGGAHLYLFLDPPVKATKLHVLSLFNIMIPNI